MYKDETWANCNGGGMPKVFIGLSQGLGSGREEGVWHNEYGSL
jgi:hypothetical protein